MQLHALETLLPQETVPVERVSAMEILDATDATEDVISARQPLTRSPGIPGLFNDHVHSIQMFFVNEGGRKSHGGSGDVAYDRQSHLNDS